MRRGEERAAQRSPPLPPVHAAACGPGRTFVVVFRGEWRPAGAGLWRSHPKPFRRRLGAQLLHARPPGSPFDTMAPGNSSSGLKGGIYFARTVPHPGPSPTHPPSTHPTTHPPTHPPLHPCFHPLTHTPPPTHARTQLSEPTYRYLLSLKVDDHTQSRWGGSGRDEAPEGTGAPWADRAAWLAFFGVSPPSSPPRVAIACSCHRERHVAEHHVAPVRRSRWSPAVALTLFPAC
jgi:hypothetical protein